MQTADISRRETMRLVRRFGVDGLGILCLLAREVAEDGNLDISDVQMFADIWGADPDKVKRVAEWRGWCRPGGGGDGQTTPRPEPPGPAAEPEPGNSPDPADVVVDGAPPAPAESGPAPGAPAAAAPQRPPRPRRPKAAAPQPPPPPPQGLPQTAPRISANLPLAAVEDELCRQIEQNDYVLFQKTGLKPEEAKKYVKEFICERRLAEKEDCAAGQLFLHFCYWKAKRPATPAPRAAAAPEDPRARERTADGKPLTADEWERQVWEAFDKMDEIDRRLHPEDYVNK